MGTEEVQPQEMFETALQSFNPTDAAIAELEKECLAIKINGLDDAIGFKAAKEGKAMMVAHRTGVESVRKGLKAGAIEYGRKIDAEARRLVGLMEPAETHLRTEIEQHKLAVQKIKDAEKEKSLKVLRDRMAQLGSVEAVYPSSMVESMTDEDFQTALDTATKEHTEKLAAKAKEEEAADKALADARQAAKEAAEKEAADRKVADALAAKERADADAKRAADEEKLKAERRQFEVEKAEREAKEAADRKDADALAAKERADADAKRAADEERLKAERRQFEVEKAEREAKEAADRKVADALAAKERAAIKAEHDKLDAERAKMKAEKDRSAAELRAKIEAEEWAEKKKRVEAEQAETAECAPRVLAYLDSIQAIELPECPFSAEIDALRYTFISSIESFLPAEVSK